MNEPRPCPTCGDLIPPETPAGLCPKCLLQAGLASGATGPTAPYPTPRGTGFVPPSLAELSARFPQLEIIELLGKGGMGAVYKARQTGLDRLVAVKILPPEVGQDPEFAERFTREARALARLNHPRIVSVFDFGQTDGLFYFIMEYVDGVNLRQAIQAGGMSPTEALSIVPQVCEALQFAHDEGIVHRDVKPENILIDKKGRVKIADFGLAKLMGQDGADNNLTGTQQVMGTLWYMAPEQLEGSREIDHRADIYSLGVVFYELLTGELPIGRFAPPSKKVQIDIRLDEVVLRALEKSPEQRYQQASDVKTQLETIRADDAPSTKSAPATQLEREVLAYLPDLPLGAVAVHRKLAGSTWPGARQAVEHIGAAHGQPVRLGPFPWWKIPLIIAAVAAIVVMSLRFRVSAVVWVPLVLLGLVVPYALSARKHWGLQRGRRDAVLAGIWTFVLLSPLLDQGGNLLAKVYEITGVKPGPDDGTVLGGIFLLSLVLGMTGMIRYMMKNAQEVAPGAKQEPDASSWVCAVIAVVCFAIGIIVPALLAGIFQDVLHPAVLATFVAANMLAVVFGLLGVRYPLGRNIAFAAIGLPTVTIFGYWMIGYSSDEVQRGIPRDPHEPAGVAANSLPASGAAERVRSIRYLTGHGGIVRSVAVSSDGQTLLSAGMDGRMMTWELPEYKSKGSFTPFGSNDNSLWTVAISADNQYAFLAGRPGQPDIYRVGLRGNVSTPIPHRTAGTVLRVVPTANGQELLGITNSQVFGCDLAGKEKFSTPFDPDKPFGNVMATAASPGGRHVAVTTSTMVPDGTGWKSAEPCHLRIFDDTGKQQLSWEVQDYAEFSYARMAFMDDNTFVMAMPSGRILRWDFQPQTPGWLPDHKPVRIAPGRYTVAARGVETNTIWLAHDRQVVLLDVTNGNLLAWADAKVEERKGNFSANPIECLAAIPNSHKVAAGLWDGRVAIVDPILEARTPPQSAYVEEPAEVADAKPHPPAEYDAFAKHVWHPLPIGHNQIMGDKSSILGRKITLHDQFVPVGSAYKNAIIRATVTGSGEMHLRAFADNSYRLSFTENSMSLNHIDKTSAKTLKSYPLDKPLVERDVAFAAFDDRLIAYLDGKRILDVTDKTISQVGQCALQADRTTVLFYRPQFMSLEGERAAEIAKLLPAQGELGAEPEYAVFAQGKWQPVNFKPEQLNNPKSSIKEGVLTLDDETVASNPELNGIGSATDAIVRAKVTGRGILYLSFHRDSYNVWLGDRVMGINKVADTKPNVLATCPLEPVADDTREVAFAAVGTRLLAYINGRRVLDVTDAEFKDLGGCGVHAYMTRATFRNIEFMSLDKVNGGEAFKLLPQQNPLQGIVGDWTITERGTSDGQKPTVRSAQSQTEHTLGNHWFVTQQRLDRDETRIVVMRYDLAKNQCPTWTFPSGGSPTKTTQVWDEKHRQGGTPDFLFFDGTRGMGATRWTAADTLETQFVLNPGVAGSRLYRQISQRATKPGEIPSLFSLPLPTLGTAQGPPDKPEWKPLQKFIGDWTNHNAETTIDPVTKEKRSDAMKNYAWTLGGRYLIDRGLTDRKPFHLGLWTYDEPAKKYRASYFLSDGNQLELTYEWKEESQSFAGTAKFRDGGTAQSLFQFVGPNSIEWTMTIDNPAEGALPKYAGRNERK